MAGKAAPQIRLTMIPVRGYARREVCTDGLLERWLKLKRQAKSAADDCVFMGIISGQRCTRRVHKDSRCIAGRGEAHRFP